MNKIDHISVCRAFFRIWPPNFFKGLTQNSTLKLKVEIQFYVDSENFTKNIETLLSSIICNEGPICRSVGPICVPIEVQTDISILPLDNFVTFSAKSCFELLPQLTDEQLDFEIRFNNEVLCRDIDYKNKRKPSRDTKLGHACSCYRIPNLKIFFTSARVFQS